MKGAAHPWPNPRPIWTGTITFGLVNIPVSLFTAVREERIAFHMLHDQDNVRLQRKMVCPADGKEVHPEHIVKGYEIHKDQYVIVRPEEIEACGPQVHQARSRSRDFVDLAEIDPVYYDRPYYVMPQAAAAQALPAAAGGDDPQQKGRHLQARHAREGIPRRAAAGGRRDLPAHDALRQRSRPCRQSRRPCRPMQKVNERELKVAEQLIDSLAPNSSRTSTTTNTGIAC